MFPANSPSSEIVFSPYVYPDDKPRELLVDWEMGGVALNDASLGNDFQGWRLWYDEDDYTIKLSTESGTNLTSVLTGVNITEVTFTFDQNMRLSVAYVQSEEVKLRWFDSVAGGIVTTSFPGAYSPMLALDDKRLISSQTSDMIFAYIKEDAVFYRIQRERFLIEHLYTNLPVGIHRINNMGMNTGYRFQISISSIG